jgi:hypothetical protein
VMPDRGLTRKAFEHAMSLKPEQCVLDSNGHYANSLTHALWHAFKAGISYAPTRGTFVVAELQSSTPYFNPAPRTYPFADLARQAMRDQALRLDRKCAVFQQITVFTPHSKSPPRAP